MNKVIAAALKRKKELQDELRRLEEFIGMYKELFSGEDAAGPTHGDNVSYLPNRRRKPSIAGVASDILRAHGRPLDMLSLLKAMEERGFKVGGKNPSANAASTFSRDPDFYFSRKHGGWWLLSLGNPDHRLPQTQGEIDSQSLGVGSMVAQARIAANQDN